jgi:DnaK suppressor protein
MDENAIRTRLLQERERLSATTGELASELDESEQTSLGELSTNDQHPADTATETVEREKDNALLTTMRARESEIEAALKRLDAGTFGKCESCGGYIGDERLDAFPMARFCIEHQAQQEG